LSAATASLDKSPAGPKAADPCILVIFGITGDLTKRLLFPALYNLQHHRLLPRQFAVGGFAISDMSQEQLQASFRDNLKEAIGPEADQSQIDDLVSRVRLVASDFESPDGWRRLHETLSALDREYNTGANYLFYLATAPEFFLPLVKRLVQEGLLAENAGWRRVIIEKPFGNDLESARALNRELLAVVRDKQIYRIDHYLGKETVQNILVFRFANGIFEPIWNRRYIDHVQISVAESVGVERRGKYYDHTGALRDMIPNHLIQLLALTAMEPPSSFSSTALQNEQVKVLEASPPIHPDECTACVVRAQYTAGAIDGQPVPGYREEPFVDPNSQTETYVALRLTVDNWRWAGVPFFLRTGKRMKCRKTEIAVQFRNPPLALFRRSATSMPQPNRLVIGVQPQEDISLEFEGKTPGPVIETSSVEMHFDYRDYFGRESRTGYETLLYDAMIGDSSLFKRADMIEGGWAVIQPILDAWEDGRGGPVASYAAGSEGPAEAEDLFQHEWRNWRAM
jgi:glucose-6-phosphate 1-dehydrogenase